MASFAVLQKRITPEIRRLFDYVWAHYLAKGTWPAKRWLYQHCTKEELTALLGSLEGNLIRENEMDGKIVVELPLAGVLNTSQGEGYSGLLKRYLEYLRDLYFHHQEVDTVKHTDVQQKLGLSSEDTAMLGRLSFAGFMRANGGHQPNFSEWGMTLSAELENVPASGPIDDSFTKILDELVRIPQSVFLVDRRTALSRGMSINAEPEPVAPATTYEKHVVMIAYSHDTKDHKRWTLELAQKLHLADIDVIIDQWDLGPGDDLAKFMERSVRKAERVLMICTEAYVTKVNEGKGGAGYEGMVVTSELIKDVGTAKFIPIIRQSGGKHERPTCVQGRSWIDLSDGADVEEELKKLISNLRRDPPPTKPRRPTMKITAEPTTDSAPAANPVLPIAGTQNPESPSQSYLLAVDLATKGDFVQWRRLVNTKKSEAEAALITWRDSVLGKLPEKKSELAAFASGAIATQQTLFAIAMGGVESGQPKFNQQGGLIYDLITPRGWEHGGSSLMRGVPELNAFSFHALLGGMTVYSNQNAEAIDLATQRVVDRSNPENSRALFLDHSLTGWPKVFGGEARPSWDFLWDLVKKFPWIAEAFGSEDGYRESICGYYLLLSWLEFLECLKKFPNYDGTQEMRLEVPPIYLRHPQHVAATRLLLRDRASLITHSERFGVSSTKQIALWGKWIDQQTKWVDSVYRLFGFDTETAEVRHFITDLHR